MITILFQTESHFPVTTKKIKEAVTQHLEKKIKSQAEVSITIVGDRRMKKLNSEYRKIEDTTDVLSFPQHDPSQTMQPFIDVPDGVMHLGDVVVSYPQAVLEAAQANKFVDDQIIFLVLHGIDHLLGIHHPE